MIKTDQDVKETQRIYDEILKKYFKIQWKIEGLQKKSFFGKFWWKNEFIEKWTYIDDKENIITILNKNLLVTFVSQNPDIARMYTISFDVYWNKKPVYSRSTNHNFRIDGLHVDSQTIEWLEKKFVNEFEKLKNRLNSLKKNK